MWSARYPKVWGVSPNPCRRRRPWRPSAGRSIDDAPATIPSGPGVRRAPTIARARAVVRVRTKTTVPLTSRRAIRPVKPPRRGTSTRWSVCRDRRIDVGTPSIDPSRQVPHTSEPPLHKELGCRPAAETVVAIQNDVPVWRDFRHGSFELPERDQSSAINAGHSPFVRLSNVDEIDRVASTNAFSKVTRSDLVNARGELAGYRCVRCTQLIVVDQRLDLARSTGRATGVSTQPDGTERHRQCVDQEQPTRERLADTENNLDRFGRLNRPDEPGKHTEHAGLRAARHEPWWRWLREEASVARAVRGREERCLAFKPQDAAVHVRLSEQHACVVREVARLEVVGTVDDHIIPSDDVERVRGTELFIDGFDAHQRVHGTKSRARGIGFSLTDICRVVQKLSLQVGRVDPIE